MDHDAELGQQLTEGPQRVDEQSRVTGTQLHHDLPDHAGPALALLHELENISLQTGGCLTELRFRDGLQLETVLRDSHGDELSGLTALQRAEIEQHQRTVRRSHRYLPVSEELTVEARHDVAKQGIVTKCW